MAKRIKKYPTAKKSARPAFEWREVAKLLSFAVVVFALVWVARGIDDIPIKTIEVVTQLEKVSKDEIRKIAGQFVHQGFFTAQLGEFENQINKIPWVYKVNVKRQWPYTLKITIEEQQPFFRWGNKQLLNRYAIAFNDENADSYVNLPMLHGTSGREQYLATIYAQYDKRFRQLGMKIVAIVEDARYDKEITLDNGIIINLGKDHVDEQLERCLQSFPIFNAEDRTKIVSIDLRHSNGFAVRWNG